MSFETLDDLRANLGKPTPTAASAAYDAKMMHQVPQTEVVNRAEFILKKVAGKRVLEFGASGPMHDAIVKAAQDVFGVDRETSSGIVGFDLDSVSRLDLPLYQPDVIVCGEVIEHLSNPGWFLTRLRRQYPGVPVLITVPNAFCSAGRSHTERGVENVNSDHVAWYSWKTMTVLLSRHGYTVNEFYFYNGKPFTAEGLVFVCS